MTYVRLVCTTDGCLKSFEAKGHAGFAQKGYDIVCAAETLLLRTAIDLLNNANELQGILDDSKRGYLYYKINNFPETDLYKERLRCIADFIRSGISSLVEEYPAYICLQEIAE